MDHLMTEAAEADEIYPKAGGDLPKRYELNEYSGQDWAEYRSIAPMFAGDDRTGTAADMPGEH